MAFPHFYNPGLDTQHPLPSSQFGMDNYKQLAFIPTYSNGHWTLDIKLDKMATIDPTVKMNMPPPWKLSSDPGQWKMEPKGKISDCKSVSRNSFIYFCKYVPKITYLLFMISHFHEIPAKILIFLYCFE